MATSTSASGAGPATPPAVSLPKGGGAIRGIGEKFGANPVTGTGSITDRGVPRYGEDPADTFVLSGAEDLVEYLGRTAGDRQPEPDPRHEAGISYTVRRYRPRIEGLFARIERWTETATGDVHWGRSPGTTSRPSTGATTPAASPTGSRRADHPRPSDRRRQEAGR